MLFRSVVVLTKVYTGVYLERKEQEQNRKEVTEEKEEKEHGNS